MQWLEQLPDDRVSNQQRAADVGASIEDQETSIMSSAKRLLLATAASVIGFAGIAVADTPAVSKIEVDTTFLSAEGSNVMSYYPDLASDVEQRIRARVAPSDDPTAPTLRVALREISLDGSTLLPDSKEFNKLEGVMSYSGGDEEVTMPISVSAEGAPGTSADGMIVIEPSTSDYYNAMVDVFVGAVVDAIPE
ncbi:hypothetical protein AB1M95_07305 [Sulfitobacter sp. LCG007]